MLLAGGMLWGNIELGEVVVVGLDIRPLGDGEPHVAENLGNLVEHLAHRMNSPILQWADAHRQRDVGLLGCETHRERPALQLGLALLQRVADPGFEAVDRLSEGLALLGRKSAEPGHQLGHAPLLAEGGNAHALDCGQVLRRGDLGDQRALDGGDVDVLCHRCHPGRSASARRAGTQKSNLTEPCGPWVPDRRFATSGMTVTPLSAGRRLDRRGP